MNRIYILTLLFAFLILNCKQKVYEKETKAKVETSRNNNEYEKINFNIKLIESNNNNLIYELDKYRLFLDLNNETAKIEIDKKKYSINLNFYYDIDLIDALNKIKIYKKNNVDIIFFIPAIGANDEITYQLLKYDNENLYVDTISFSVFTENQNHFIIKESNKKYEISIGSNIITGFFVKKLDGNPITNIEQYEKTLPSNLKGMWGVECQNELTELDINKSEGFLSLYSPNAIYINLKVEKSTNENEYILKFASTSSQRDYYPEMLKVKDEEISKDKIIGRLILKKEGKAELHWIGLYNTKKQKLEFVGDDFLFIKENGGRHPVLLEKCE